MTKTGKRTDQRALIVSFVCLKGGVGKSTLAYNIANALHMARTRVLLIDADPQNTCRKWNARAVQHGHDGAPLVVMNGASLRRDLTAVTSACDVAIIDSPPAIAQDARFAMLAADLVVMPVVPGTADIDALDETIKVFEDARSLRPELRAVVVLNRADRSGLSSAAAEYVNATFGGAGIPLLARITQRVDFGYATAVGQGVMSFKPKSEAAGEVQALTKAILSAARTHTAATEVRA